jgi:uncharacterized protein involved in copper resistance
MTRVMRLLVILLLTLAVPLQGLAGVTMAACGMAHGIQGGAAMSHGPGPAAMDHSAMDHAAMDHAAMGHGHSDAAPHASDQGPMHEAHDCAACAACCSLSAAPVPALLVQGASPAPSVAIPFLEVARASFAPEGLDRPPSPAVLG